MVRYSITLRSYEYQEFEFMNIATKDDDDDSSIITNNRQTMTETTRNYQSK